MASKKKQQNIPSTKLAEYEAKQAQAQAGVFRNKRDNKRAIILGAGALAVAGLLQLAYFGFGPGPVSYTHLRAHETG
jgi:hypothetical protein